jgi:hypothetical protein
MGIADPVCTNCGLQHEQSFMVAVSQELCIRSLGAKVVDLENRLKTLALECERELNRVHDLIKQPRIGAIQDTTRPRWSK